MREARSARLPGPPGLPGKPMRSLTLTAGGPWPELSRGSAAWDAAPHPPGGDALPGEPRLFSAPSRLPALNGSVIDWPRVLFSPRAAGAGGRRISIFPAAAPRCGSSCSRPPRRPPRIYLWFNKKWELSQGLGLVESSQHKF